MARYSSSSRVVRHAVIAAECKNQSPVMARRQALFRFMSPTSANICTRVMPNAEIVVGYIMNSATRTSADAACPTKTVVVSCAIRDSCSPMPST